MADITKHLERAKKYLEKNKLEDAIQEYQIVLEASPNSVEVIQALGDIHMRLNQPDRAANYYGMLFDRFAESRDTARAVILYTRSLKNSPQPPERIARFAVLLQKQNKRDEAIESYNAAAEAFLLQKNEAEALACWDKIAQLDPENVERHLKIGEVGERLNKPEVAARGYLRAGQLALAASDVNRAIDLLSRGNKLMRSDRSVALFLAQALLRKGEFARAVTLLEPFPIADADAPFLETFGEALLRTGKVDRALEVFEQFHRDKPETYAHLFDVAGGYVKAEQENKAVKLLTDLKERMFETKKQNEFAVHAEEVAAAHPKSVPVAEFVVRLYDELNRESKFFDSLVTFFDLCMEAGNVPSACNALDRLVDIDPYDFRNQERVTKLKGKADPNYIRGIEARMAKAASVGGQVPTINARGAQEPVPPSTDEGRARQALDDLIVQTEIFMQYSLHDKAVERLKKIGEMFPGEEATNDRLRNLCQQANFWPSGKPPAAAAAPAPSAAPATTAATPSPSKSGVYSAEVVRDLARISEITRTIYRQSTPKSVLATAVNEIGKHLKVTRCLGVVAPPGQPPQMASEFCAPDVEVSDGSAIVQLLTILSDAPPDAVGSVQVTVSAAPVLREMGLVTALGVPLTDKETQKQAGMLIVGNATPRDWKPSEGYFLQAIGDQMVLSVNHTKLRSLVRTLAVADEKTGLLSRSSYQDCLLAEMNRAKTQGTPVSLVLLHLDKGPELIRQKGEAMLAQFMEKLARALQNGVRQNDVPVKYTAWSLAFVLPDTNLENATALADKLRKISAGVKAPWDQGQNTLSGAVAEATIKPEFDSEDIVTDLINRAEFGLDDARKKGGDTVSSL
jgi:diguanylate cyclase (GGDEF)-like protein